MSRRARQGEQIQIPPAQITIPFCAIELADPSEDGSAALMCRIFSPNLSLVIVLQPEQRAELAKAAAAPHVERPSAADVAAVSSAGSVIVP